MIIQTYGKNDQNPGTTISIEDQIFDANVSLRQCRLNTYHLSRIVAQMIVQYKTKELIKQQQQQPPPPTTTKHRKQKIQQLQTQEKTTLVLCPHI